MINQPIDLPHKPGVYRFLNQDKKIIYVGKAKDLQKRVSQYFRKNIADKKTQVLMQHAQEIEITITDNENQALLLECNLIKKHHPKYNILLRDDKSYPYLFLQKSSARSPNDFPRLDYHRGPKKEKGYYFGPYPNAGSVRDNLALIQKLFKLRQCSDVFFSHRTRPCLQYQIDRCTAPCVHYVTKESYAEQVKDAVDFLEGKNKIVLKSLQKRMQDASRDRAYEKAAMFRDVIHRLKQLQEKQVITDGKGNSDFFGVAEQHGVIAIAVVSVRHGQMLGHKTFFPHLPDNTTIADALSAFIPQYYLNAERATEQLDRIVLSHTINDREWIQNFITDTLHSQKPSVSAGEANIIKILIPNTRNKQHDLLVLAIQNAEHELEQHLSDKNTFIRKMETLQNALHLPNKPERIECFDISHTQGSHTKASCVVFGADGPLKKYYRQFNIDNITPGDDYAAMAQVLTRRYTKLKKDNAALPDLIIIDGGKGQLKIAATILESLQLSGVMLLGVAKGVTRKAGVEKLWIWGNETEIDLPENSPARHLIQQIRDEAHRFAITSHRKAMRKFE